MPRYLSLHTLACLTRQGAGQLTERIFSASRVKARRAPRQRIGPQCHEQCEAENSGRGVDVARGGSERRAEEVERDPCRGACASRRRLEIRE